MTDLAAIKAELRTLLEKASELPWKRDERYIVGQVRGGRPGGEVIATAGMTWKGHDGDTPENREADAALIVAAVNALPALLADSPSVEPPAVSHEATSTTGQANSGGGRDADIARIAAVLSASLDHPDFQHSHGRPCDPLSDHGKQAARLYDAGLRPSVEPAGLADARRSGERLAEVIHEAEATNREWAKGADFVLGWTINPDDSALEVAHRIRLLPTQASDSPEKP